MSHALVFSIACLGLNLLFGTTGLLSFGHATYFGAGAYTGAFLYRFFGVTSFEVYLVSGVVFSTILAAAIGYLCVQVTRIYFAILTLAFAMVVYSLFIDGAIFRLFGGVGWALYLLTGGALYIPRLTMLGTEFGPEEFIPVFYFVIVGAFLGSVFLLLRISRSPFGGALRAIRNNETRATFIGIPVRRYRWYAFILSGLFVGLAGGLYGQLARQITPEQLHWLFSAKLILATVLGGMQQCAGPVLGAFAFIGVDELSTSWAVGRNFAFGILLILIVLAFPKGIAGGFMFVIEIVSKFRKSQGHDASYREDQTATSISQDTDS
ncbi:MAG: branched-chain amino acid ABC transporter permease [Acidiferrobacterales bacterium]|nr:branched-chain amino acid ABC transporter permease [Acidiferrobacterales bacterium]